MVISRSSSSRRGCRAAHVSKKEHGCCVAVIGGFISPLALVGVAHAPNEFVMAWARRGISAQAWLCPPRSWRPRCGPTHTRGIRVGSAAGVAQQSHSLLGIDLV